MKIKNNQLMTLLFFPLLFSFTGKTDNAVPQENPDISTSVEKKESVLINDSFHYQIVLVSEKSESGLYGDQNCEVIADPHQIIFKYFN